MKYSVSVALCFIVYTVAGQEPVSGIAQADRFINNYQFTEALNVLAASSDSLNTNVLQRKAYCYSRLGNHVEAVDLYEQIVRIDSANRNALFQLGQLYSRANQYTNAERCYQRLLQYDTLNSFYYKQYANAAFDAADFTTAVVHYLRAVRINEGDTESYYGLGNALMELEQYPLADSILVHALEVRANNQLRLLLAKVRMEEEKYESVIEITHQLLVNADTIPVYARLLGISYFQLDQYDKVIPCMKFLQRNGSKAEWIYYYQGVAFQQLHQPDSAIAYLNKAIDAGISNNIGTYYTQLAMSYESVKDFKNAIKHYKAAYESSKSGILLYHLARNYDTFYKDKTQAIAYYKRYLSSDDTIKIAKQYTQLRLNQLMDYR